MAVTSALSDRKVPYIAAEQRICAECAPLAIIIRTKNDDYIYFTVTIMNRLQMIIDSAPMKS
jgi:hypothetical protein